MAYISLTENLNGYLQEPLKVPVCDQSFIAPPPGLEPVMPETEAGLHLATLSAQEQRDAVILAQQSAALALENARLQGELMLMRLQSQSMAPMPYAQMGFNASMYSPWGSPMTASSLVYKAYAPKTTKPRGTKQTSKVRTQEKLKLDASGFESASTASGEDSTPRQRHASDDDQDVSGSVNSEEPARTTVMLRNVPNHVTVEQLLDLMNENGFSGCYNLVYLPMDFKTKLGLGYAFVDLKSPQQAQAFFKIFHGFNTWTLQSDKVCEVAWSALQGIDEHVERYRNSPVMHESVPDEFRPVLFKDNEQIPFPPPTKRIRAPRQWSRRH